MRKRRIIFYDFADLSYSAYFLNGFFRNEKKFDYDFAITKKIPYSILQDVGSEWRETLFSIALFKVEADEGSFHFCIDARDSCKADAISRGYCLPLLKEVAYYFKVNNNRQAIADDPKLKNYSNIIKGLPLFFPVSVEHPLKFLPRILPSRSVGWDMRRSRVRLSNLIRLPSLEEMRALRHVKRDLDIFFVVGFYDEREHRADNDFRLRIMTEIKKYRNISYMMGFADMARPSQDYAEFMIERRLIRDYLNHLARAKVAIYVRGLHDCISFKLGQYLSLGKAIVGQRILNNEEFFYSSGEISSQFAFEEPETIAKKAVELIGTPDKVKQIGESNARIFDEKLAPDITISNLLDTIFVQFHR